MLSAQNNTESLVRIGIALALFVLTFVIYLGGISDSFIFDDVHNLKPIAASPDLPLVERFTQYVTQQIAGPTGRPVSAATFFLNGTEWPTSATPYKLTNIVLHLITGGLIFMLSNLMLVALNLGCKRRRYLICILATSLWMLSPMQVSTVLYVVQRMTQLYVLFLLGAAILYVKLRIDIHRGTLAADGDAVSRSQWIGLWLGCGMLVALAMGSKEAAINFPLLILALDCTILSQQRWPNSVWKTLWRLCAIALPVVGLIVYTIISWPVHQNNFVLHDFGPVERLLTQPRVLVDYLATLLFPRVDAIGLIHDDYVASRSLLNPIATLPALIAIVAALFFAWMLRHRFKVAAFAIFWFTGAHALEAGVLPIELYFEHRNYLAAFGIAFAVAVAVEALSKLNPVFAKLAATAAVVALAVLCFQTTTIWKNPIRQAEIWAAEHPQSLRAKLTAGHMLRASGNTVQAMSLLDPRGFENPSSAHYIAYGNMSCMTGTPPRTPWLEAAANKVSATYVARFLPMQIQYILLTSLEGKCSVTGEDVIKLVDAHLAQPGYRQYQQTNYDLHAIKQRVLANLGHLDEAVVYLDRMHAIKPDPGLLLTKSSIHLDLANFDEAEAAVIEGLKMIKAETPDAPYLRKQFAINQSAIAKARNSALTNSAQNTPIVEESVEDGAGLDSGVISTQ